MSDKLLEVISTRGHMSLEDFNTAFDRLVPLSEERDRSFARRDALYAFDALGHCEKDWSRQRLFACRPVLARLPAAGCPRVVLTGARTAQTVVDLRTFAKNNPDATYLSCSPQSEGLPDVVTVEAADEAMLSQCAVACRLPISGELPAAWTLANASGSLTDYEATLDWKIDAPLNWQQRVFDPRTFFFRRTDDPYSAELLTRLPRLTEHINPITQQRDCRWTKEGFYAMIARDWGRWLALAVANEKALLYDIRRQRLAAPFSVPLPRLLARAATLCSGQASYTDIANKRNVYDSVPASLAELIARKCGQTYKPALLERPSDHA